MDNLNLFAALRAAFPQDLDRVAIETDDGLNYSWRDLDRASAMVANLLDSLALPPASRVAVQVEKSVEALVLYLATLRAGHVFLPLNTAYQSAEIEYFIGNAEPAVVVCSPGQFGWVSKIAFTAGTRHVFTLGDNRTGSLLERSVHMSDRHTPAVRGDDDLAAILYTSGTTGRSKGAMLTHGNLRSNAEVLKTYWGWRPDDVLIHALPIFHVHGLFVALHGALINGSKMFWMSKFDPKLAIARFSEATVFMGVPTLYTRMLAEPGLTVQQAAHMRLFISGSAPLLIETFNEWKVRTGHTILERYGMSETAMLTSNPCSADARHGGATERRGGTVGFPLPGVELRVMGEDGHLVQPGEIGGIQVRGPNIFKGYWRMPEKTAEEFTADGFFKTGDVGRIDERGYVNIVGRSKDLIISGGYNVYPAEIEGYINELPGVVESAVIGVPHPDFGEVGVALLIAKPGAQVDAAQVLASLKSRLANFKIPKRCFVVAELPRNTMGKVQKNLLREEHKGLFA
ncbi:MAG: malonyl-CoA synthase [Polaromonas sp.]|nr:malonyl-CoA synthase [Polaromonas sp.]